MKTPHIALDFTSLDRLNISNGQYRYVVDLVRGLAALPVEARFTLLGSRPEPPPEAAGPMGASNRWDYVQLTHGKFRGADVVDQWTFGWQLARMRVDLLHALHTFIPRFRPFRVVVTEHDLMFDLFDEYAHIRRCRQYRHYRRSVKRADRLIAISETTAKDLVRLHQIDPKRVDIVYHGSSFGPRQSHTVRVGGLLRERSGPVLLSPYNLEPRKNIRALLRAAALLRVEFPQMELVLYGRAAYTPEREREFDTWLREEGLESCVRRPGFVDDDNLQALYRSCTLFVFPSLYEGFGLPLLEAMANGACVVARDASAMAEIVADAGVLVETSNTHAFAEAMAFVLRDGFRRRTLQIAAQNRASTFTIAAMAAKTYQSYCKALKIDVASGLGLTAQEEMNRSGEPLAAI
jgi:glycosyltransferase involved in cell wall biosynthesis